MDGCMDLEMMDGCIDAWQNHWQMNDGSGASQMDVEIDRRMDGRMYGCMHEWMYRCMGVQMYGCMHVCMIGKDACMAVG